jgi:uncharacterized repeat protein (TIGR02543 family)
MITQSHPQKPLPRRLLAFGLASTLAVGLAGFQAPVANAIPTPCDDLFDPASGNYTGLVPGIYTCEVPQNVNGYDFVVRGGAGGAAGRPYEAGYQVGARIDGRIDVTSGSTLTITVGSQGSIGADTSGGSPGGGGGGYSSIESLGSPMVVAGGGGGRGSNLARGGSRGGAAGAPTPGGTGEVENDGYGLGGVGAQGSTGGIGGINKFSLAPSGGAGGSLGSPGEASQNGGGGGGGAGWTSNAGTPAQGGSASSCGFTPGPVSLFGGGGAACRGAGGGGGFAGGGGGGAYDPAYGGGGGGGGSSLVPTGANITIAFANLSDLVARVDLVVNNSQPPAPTPDSGGSVAPVSVTVGLSANGGVGSVPALVGDAGTWTAAPSGAGLSRPGFVFTGWNTAADGSGTAFAAGADIALTGNNTLFAQWTVDSTTGGGQGSGGSSGGASGSGLVGDLAPTTGNGQIPAGGVARGASLLLIDGVSALVTVEPNRANVANATGLSVTGPGFSMDLSGRGDTSDPLGVTRKQALVLQSDQSNVRARKVSPVAESSGSGFLGESEVRFFLLADTYLGAIDTDSAGDYSGTVPIPAGITPGTYTLQANGFAPNGQVRSLSLGVVVTGTDRATVLSAKATVYFAPLSATLNAASKKSLQSVVKKTGKKVNTAVVVGFVQPVGPQDNDQSLSTARARTVAAYLKSLGMRGTFKVKGDGRAEESGAQARRVDIRITFTQ